MNTDVNGCSTYRPGAEPLQVGSIVVAKARTGICEIGERGVVYEVYDRQTLGGSGRGVSVIFASGRYDGFSPNEQREMLTPTGQVCAGVAGYVFRNVLQLDADFRSGLFAPAFIEDHVRQGLLERC